VENACWAGQPPSAQIADITRPTQLDQFQQQFAKRLRIGGQALVKDAVRLKQGKRSSMQGGEMQGGDEMHCFTRGARLSIMSDDEVTQPSIWTSEILREQAKGRDGACTSSALVMKNAPAASSFLAGLIPSADADSVPTMILYRSPSPMPYDDEHGNIAFEGGGGSLSIVDLDYHSCRRHQATRRPFLCENPMTPMLAAQFVSGVVSFLFLSTLFAVLSLTPYRHVVLLQWRTP